MPNCVVTEALKRPAPWFLVNICIQPEPVYYFHEKIECRQKWDVSRQWNLTARPLFKQKPLAITKQKPDKQKQQLKNRNIQRARDMGKEYIPKGF